MTEPRPDATLEHQQRREVHQSPHACTPWRHHRSFFVHGEVSSALHEETEFFHYSSWGKTWWTRLLQDQEHINVEKTYKKSEVAVEHILQIRTRLWSRTSFRREEDYRTLCCCHRGEVLCFSDKSIPIYFFHGYQRQEDHPRHWKNKTTS